MVIPAVDVELTIYAIGWGRVLTLSLPRVPKIKIQGKSQISFVKKLKYK